MRKLVVGTVMLLAAAAWTGQARAQACANPCVTPQVHIVYFGATAPNQAVNIAMKSLYGDPINTCSSIIKVYRCMRDLDNNGTPETCVQAYVGDNLGSCEGVQALDEKLSNFNVCDPNAAGAPNSGAAGFKQAGLINDELGNPLYANFACSDVSYSLCEPVVNGAVIQRSNMFDDTEKPVFVNGFGFIVNRAIEAQVDARGKATTAGTCGTGGTGVYGPASSDCLKLDLDISASKAKRIFGNNDLCDWRWLSKDVDPTVQRNIGTVMRNRLSGTRRNFNVTALQNQAPGQGNIYIAGSGAMVTQVNGNHWCGDSAAICGEDQSTGVVGGGVKGATCVGTNANTIALGYLGVDRFINVDNGTPADPHDDWSARNNGADNYVPIKYEGFHFSKAATRCGRYQYWSVENSYYDNDTNVVINGRAGYFPPGSTKEKAVKELANQLVTDATGDPTLIPLPDMFFSRARDGAAPAPSAAYNAFCDEP